MNSKYRSWRWFAAVAVLGLLVAACSPAGTGDTTTTVAGQTTTSGDGGGGTTTTAPPAGNPGLDGCAEDPLNCNSGPRAEGGDLVFLINQAWDGWNIDRPEGGSVYAIQALEGIQVDIGEYAPDGTWNWNMDALAEEPVLVSENPLTIQYVLSDAAVWNNGDGTTTPVTVDDFIYSWYHNSGNPEHCVQEGDVTCSPRATQRVEDIVSVEGSDDGKTVTVTFPEDYAYPEWFALYGSLYYPAHIAMAEGHDWNTPEGMASASVFFNTTVPYWSGGPYLIENATLGERVVMVPNDQWYGTHQPTLDTLAKELISESEDWLPALNNRDIHGGSPASFSVDLVEQFASTPDVYYGLGSGGAVWEHVDVNMQHPALADVELRKAIFTAIDREDARTRIYGDLEPPFRNNHIFPQANLAYYEDKMTGTGYGTGDVEAARAILEAAGYTGMDGGPGALTSPDGTPVGPLRFSWVQGNTNRETFVQLAQSYLGEIGIEVTPHPTESLGATLTEADYELVIFGWSGSPLFTSAPGQFWHSESGSNFGRYSNPDVDTLTDDIANQVDIDDSAALTNEAVELVMADAYVMPLWDTLNFMFVGSELANIRDNHFNSLRSYYNVDEWGFLAN